MCLLGAVLQAYGSLHVMPLLRQLCAVVCADAVSGKHHCHGNAPVRCVPWLSVGEAPGAEQVGGARGSLASFARIALVPHPLLHTHSRTHPSSPPLSLSLNLCSYEATKASIDAFNAENRWRKRGIAITPHKYAIHYGSFAHGSSIIRVYADGSVDVSTCKCQLLPLVECSPPLPGIPRAPRVPPVPKL